MVKRIQKGNKGRPAPNKLTILKYKIPVDIK